jgi:hypothetical protein
MVWEFLLFLQIDVAYLEPLVEVIYQGDLANTPPVGLHTIMWGAGIQKNPLTGQRLTDMEMMAVGFELLDRAAAWLKHKETARLRLEKMVIWKSADNLIWALKGGKASSAFAAFEQGAILVIYEGEPFEAEGGVSYPIGVSRSNKHDNPHVGDLVDEITDQSVMAEVDLWFRHEAGFISGRGGYKAPFYEPSKADLMDLAMAIDKVWKR